MHTARDKSKTRRSFNQVPRKVEPSRRESFEKWGESKIVLVFDLINLTFYTTTFNYLHENGLPPLCVELDRAKYGQLGKDQIVEQKKEKLAQMVDFI
jgi:hypothetical protein